MAIANKILKNFALFIDGFGFAGNVESAQLPTVEIMKEDYRAGGMEGSIAIDMGLNALEASWKLHSFDENALSTWGLGEGYRVDVILRGALESLDGSVTPIEAYMQGTIRSVAPSEFTAGGKASLDFVMDVRIYRYLSGGSLIYDIDVINNKRVIRGLDVNKDINSALGNAPSTLIADLASSSGISRAQNVIRNIGNILG